MMSVDAWLVSHGIQYCRFEGLLVDFEHIYLSLQQFRHKIPKNDLSQKNHNNKNSLDGCVYDMFVANK